MFNSEGRHCISVMISIVYRCPCLGLDWFICVDDLSKHFSHMVVLIGCVCECRVMNNTSAF